MKTSSYNLDHVPPINPAKPPSLARSKSLGVPEPPQRSLLRRLHTYRPTNKKRFF